MKSEEDFITALRGTRPGFVEEGRLHKLLVESYTGGGGFSNGRVPTPPVPFWGLGAYEDARLWQVWFANKNVADTDGMSTTRPAQESPSYLNAFYGENNLEYRDRIDNSTYTNVVEPIVNVVRAFLMESDATRKELGTLRTRWLHHVTQSGDSMHQFMESVLLRGQLVGWCVLLVDTPDVAAANLADSLHRKSLPFLTAYWPQQVLDYDLDGAGNIKRIKFSTWHELDRASMLEPKRLAERITVWTATHWERWEIVDEEEVDLDTQKPPDASDRIVQVVLPKPDGKRVIRDHKGPIPHQFGRVPAVIFRWSKPPNDDPIKGHPQIATIAQIARKLYNLESERDDQLRKQTFGVLVVPASTDTGRDTQQGQVNIGTGNYFEEPWGAKGLTRYIAPPGTPLDAYDRTIDRKTMDAYRTSLVDPGLSRAAETAEARKIRFRQTNAMLAHVAANLDRAELEVLKLVGFVFGLYSDPDADPVEVKRKDDYAIVHVIGEVVKSVSQALNFPMSPESKAAIVNAGIRSMLTDLADDDMAKLEELNRLFIVKQASEAPPRPAAPPAADPPPAAPPGDPPADTSEPAAAVAA